MTAPPVPSRFTRARSRAAAAAAAGALLLVPALPGTLAGEEASEDPSRAVDAALRVPERLEVRAWARSPLVRNPTSIDTDARGRIWVAEAVNYRGFNNRERATRWREDGDRIVILEDTDRDGRADASKVFVQEEELVAPLGVAVLGDRVVVSCSPRLIVYRRDERDRVVDRQVLLEGWGGLDHDHSLHAVQAGPDGRWYFNVGNAGPHVVTDRSGWTLRSGSWYTGGTPYNTENTPGLESDDGRVWHGGLALRVRPDGTGLEVLGHGFRNSYGLCVDSFGDLWMNDNDDTASCRTTWLLEGGDCGYNSKDGTRSWQADRRPWQSIPVAHWRQEDPGVIPSGHVYGNGAPTGITYYEGGALGPAYEDGLLLSCEAGQNVVWGYRREPRGAGFALEAFPFLTSVEHHDPGYVWHERPEDRRKWFRPSDVLVGADGAVYVADWFDPIVGGHRLEDAEARGTIYRVTRPGAGLRVPDVERRTLEGQLDFLASPAANVRYRGFRELARRGAPAVPAVVRRFERTEDRFLRARCLFLLARLGGPGLERVEEALGADDPELRVAALRALRSVGHRVREAAARLARVPEPAARRAAAIACRDLPPEERVAIVLDVAAGHVAGDRWSLEAIGLAAGGLEERLWPELLARQGAPTLSWPDAFAELAWRLHPETAVPALLDRALAPEVSRAAREQAVDALAFVSTRRAADAMVRTALEGPADVRSRATWWARHRATNDWSAFEPAARLDEATGDRPAEPAFRSDVLRRGSVAIDVEIAGAERLWLVCEDAGDGKGCDWCDWLEPVLVGPGGEEPLTETAWTAASAGWGEVRVGRDCAGGPLRCEGRVWKEGIGTHAPSTIEFAVDGERWIRLRVRAAVDDGGPDRGGATHRSGAASVRFLVYHDGPTALERALGRRERLLDADTSPGARDRVARALARTPEGGRILLALAARGELPAGVEDVVAGCIHECPDLAVRALAARRFGPPPGADEAPDPAAVLAREADAARGREVFFGEEAACSRCHTLEGDGARVGPDLSAIGEKYDAAQLLESILAPGAAVLAGYETQVVVTRRGAAYTGRLLADGDTVVVLDASGERHAIPREEIAHRAVEPGSLMPDGVALGLGARELADLVRFLHTRTGGTE